MKPDVVCRHVVCRYYEPVKAPLVQSTMLPAARAAERSGATAHLERHWLHGPYVAVALRGDADSVAVAAERVGRLVADGVARHPSTSATTVAEILAASEASGRAELVPGPYEPVYPDNTVQVEDADRRALADLLGGRATVEVRADMLAAALDAIDVSTATVPRTSAGRVRMATAAMAAHAACYGHGVAGGYMSFLSHLEDFLFRNDANGALRAAFDRVWLRQSDAVTAEVAHAVDVGSGRADADDPVVAAWSAWSGAAVALATEAFARGDLPLVPGDGYRARAEQFDDPELAGRWGGAAGHQLSAFHQVTSELFDVDAVAEVFGPYRFATNVLYQVLLVCDVTAMERYLAASLVSKAVGRLTGSDWRRLVPSAAGVAR